MLHVFDHLRFDASYLEAEQLRPYRQDESRGSRLEEAHFAALRETDVGQPEYPACDNSRGAVSACLVI